MTIPKTRIKIVTQHETESVDDYQNRLQSELDTIGALEDNYGSTVALPMMYQNLRICTMLQWQERKKLKGE